MRIRPMEERRPGDGYSYDGLSRLTGRLDALGAGFPGAVEQAQQLKMQPLATARLRLELLNPQLVLKRGYAWLATTEGQAITRRGQTHIGQQVRATLMDGEVDLVVSAPRLI